MNLLSGSYAVTSHLRYTCEEGYKRQPGTSNLAICHFNEKTRRADWKYGNISCIRDPLIPFTTPSNSKSPLITSVSSSSPVSISSTTVESFTTILSTPTMKIHEAPHTTQEDVTQTTQIPGHTSVIRLSTMNDHSAPERTHSPDLQLFTQTLLPKETVETITEQTTVSTNTTATVTENTGYTATVKQSTPVQTTNISDTETNTWQKSETIAIAVGNVVGIILLVGVIILVIYCRRKSVDTSPRNTEDTRSHLQDITLKDRSPALNTSDEGSEEDSFL